jgi:hypothetical protein
MIAVNLGASASGTLQRKKNKKKKKKKKRSNKQQQQQQQPLQFSDACFINALFINLEAPQPVPKLVSEETCLEIKENSIPVGRYRKHPRSCILLRSFSLFFGPHESNLKPQLSVGRD